MNIELKVTDQGFVPNELRARAGEEVRLSIKRTYARTCATSIQSPGVIEKTKLPLGETVEVAFRAEKAGRYRFGCAMGMHIGGELVVEP